VDKVFILWKIFWIKLYNENFKILDTNGFNWAGF
jgi:hypothetical protein